MADYPYTFSPFTKAKASQVNANNDYFDNLIGTGSNSSSIANATEIRDRMTGDPMKSFYRDGNNNIYVYHYDVLTSILIPTDGDIQSAIDYIVTQPEQITIEFLSGRHTITTPIDITESSNLVITGQGSTTEIFCQSNIANIFNISNINQEKEIKNFTVETAAPFDGTIFDLSDNSVTDYLNIHNIHIDSDNTYTNKKIFDTTGGVNYRSLNLEFIISGGRFSTAIDLNNVDSSYVKIISDDTLAQVIDLDSSSSNNTIIAVNSSVTDNGSNNTVIQKNDLCDIAWTPSYSASGSMTWTSVSTDYATYQRIGNRIHFMIRASGTTGGTASTLLQFTAPAGLTPSTGAVNIGGGCRVGDGSGISGTWIWNDAAGLFQVSKYDASNFGLGANKVIQIDGSYPI